jgi:tRNA nucleotidyltransferase (CCA-adding enzyme)
MNISKQLSNVLTDNQFAALKIIGDSAYYLDVEAFLVGGSVRDLILGTKLNDIDVCIESDLKTFIDSIPDSDREVITISQFGTAKIKICDEIIDLVMTRMEFYSESGELPYVTFSDIHNDIYRRDFTINTLAVSVVPNKWGELLDICGGMSDIKSRIIRILHPTSLLDDPTRIFRAFRYSVRLGFEIDQLTLDSIDLNSITRLSGIRISNELKHIFSEKKCVETLNQLEEFNILKSIHPELSFSGHLGHVFSKNHTEIASCLDYGILLIVRDIKSPITRMILGKRLGLTKNMIKAITDIENIERLPVSKYSDLYSLLNEVSDLTLAISKMYEGNSVKSQIDIFINELRHINLKITGVDVMEKGISGLRVGIILEKMKTLLLDGEVADTQSAQIAMLGQLIESE